MDVAAHEIAFPADDKADFGVNLHAHKTIDDVDAFLFQFFRPSDVAFLVKTRLEFHHGHDLLAAPPRLNQRLDNGGVVADAVQRLLDGDDIRVLGRAADKIQDGKEIVIGMEEEDVLRSDGREEVPLAQGWVRARMERLFLELRFVHIVERHEFGKGHGALDAVNLEGLQPQTGGKEGDEALGRAMGDFQAHHVAEAALIHKVLDGFQKVVGLVLLDFQIGVACDAEQRRVLHPVPGEEHGQILGHKIFQRQNVVAAHIGIEAQRGVGLGLLVARNEDEA